MNQNKYDVKDFSKHLFWDVDSQKLSLEGNARLIVERVLGYGLKKDWDLLYQIYGLEKIGEIAKNLRTLDEVAMHFIAHKCKIPIEEFRCYTYQQSIPHFSGY